MTNPDDNWADVLSTICPCVLETEEVPGYVSVRRHAKAIRAVCDKWAADRAKLAEVERTLEQRTHGFEGGAHMIMGAASMAMKENKELKAKLERTVEALKLIDRVAPDVAVGIVDKALADIREANRQITVRSPGVIVRLEEEGERNGTST